MWEARGADKAPSALGTDLGEDGEGLAARRGEHRACQRGEDNCAPSRHLSTPICCASRSGPDLLSSVCQH